MECFEQSQPNTEVSQSGLLHELLDGTDEFLGRHGGMLAAHQRGQVAPPSGDSFLLAPNVNKISWLEHEN